MERRVLLVNVSRFFGDIIQELLGEDFRVQTLGRRASIHDFRKAVSPAPADLVVFGVKDDELPRVRELVDAYSRMKVLAVVEEGERGVVYEFTPRTSFAGALTRERLLEAVGTEAGRAG